MIMYDFSNKLAANYYGLYNYKHSFQDNMLPT